MSINRIANNVALLADVLKKKTSQGCSSASFLKRSLSCDAFVPSVKQNKFITSLMPDNNFNIFASKNSIITIKGKKIKLNTIIDSSGRKFIQEIRGMLDGSKINVSPQTYSKGNKVYCIQGIKYLDGTQLASILSEEYLLRIRNKLGREITNYDVFNSSGFSIPIVSKLSKDSEAALIELANVNPKKFQTVFTILKNTNLIVKTKDGVTSDYVDRFILKLIQCNDKLLKNVADNNIPVKIYDDVILHTNAFHATYSHGTKYRIENGKKVLDMFGEPIVDKDISGAKLIFSQKNNGTDITSNGVVIDTVESLPHELGHAFDYNMGNKFNLHQQDFISVVDGQNFSRYVDLISFSKEFDEAITKDIIALSEKSVEINGLKNYSQIFDEILLDADFNYYFGEARKAKTPFLDKNGNPISPIIFNDVTARKELFAQMVSYITSGHVTNVNFERKIEEYFPNMLEFTRQLFE